MWHVIRASQNAFWRENELGFFSFYADPVLSKPNPCIRTLYNYWLSQETLTATAACFQSILLSIPIINCRNSYYLLLFLRFRVFNGDLYTWKFRRCRRWIPSLTCIDLGFFSSIALQSLIAT
ncbi:hypothetical protein HanXRQr2_Chr01g0002501 [Helianthus annuus]|uniref:Uncharacterized protein n=1 Tax=Helianthus annuus TaxID=4232 RepID=A0A9K3JT05_HELAN|nr:hypothetical protein HanXRQr2_Chr01g0002501 [Helianthus annuus]KAJ0620926.1 hypothetical protein HanIR_Chr01g0002901 [Helianthus annuus]KAJ0625500.1 hypothetical protein HanHA89_Chr01g0002351 [Helianthus annuus]